MRMHSVNTVVTEMFVCPSVRLPRIRPPRTGIL